MKKLILMLAMLVAASPAMAAVTITIDNSYGTENDCLAAIKFSSDANVSGFGLDITVDSGASIIAVEPNFTGECTASSKGFGIFPASFDRFIDPEDPNYNDPCYTPVADSGDAGAQGGLGTGGVTIEMGALYEAGNNPAKNGTLCVIEVSADCNVTVTENSARGGIVLEDGTDGTLSGGGPTTVVCGYVYPDCWGYSGTAYLTQCHGDSSGDGAVGLLDFYDLRDSWTKSYPDGAYLPCIDIDRDGTVGLLDFYEVRDNWSQSVSSDCPAGDLNEVYKP